MRALQRVQMPRALAGGTGQTGGAGPELGGQGRAQEREALADPPSFLQGPLQQVLEAHSF